jgi:hypothetical protein
LPFFTIGLGVYLSFEVTSMSTGAVLSKMFVMKEFFVYELYFLRLERGRIGLNSFGLNLDKSLL